MKQLAKAFICSHLQTSLSLNISRNGDSTNSLGSSFQSLTTLSIKKLFLKSHLTLYCCSLRLCALLLPPVPALPVPRSATPATNWFPSWREVRTLQHLSLTHKSPKESLRKDSLRRPSAPRHLRCAPHVTGAVLAAGPAPALGRSLLGSAAGPGRLRGSWRQPGLCPFRAAVLAAGCGQRAEGGSPRRWGQRVPPRPWGPPPLLLRDGSCFPFLPASGRTSGFYPGASWSLLGGISGNTARPGGCWWWGFILGSSGGLYSVAFPVFASASNSMDRTFS